jgi:RimJ/RimL family protein N-acetyltransferase
MLSGWWSAVDIVSQRLVLRPMPLNFLRASAEGRSAAELSTLIGLRVAADWLDETDLAALRLGDLLAEPGYAPWSVRAVALRDSGEMIGHTGFHTQPAPDYLAPYAQDAVEVGYTIYPGHRRRGHGREVLTAMIRWAHVDQGVVRFVASVSPDNRASCALLASAGFLRIASFIDDIDGLEYVMMLDGEPLARLLAGTGRPPPF